MLMQGLTIPASSMCAPQPLPPVRQHSSSQPTLPTNPHPLNEPEDNTGKACVRGSRRSTLCSGLPTSTSAPTPTPHLPSLPTELEVEVTTIPHTTAWRQKKRCAGSLPQPPQKRKYNCQTCGHSMSGTGHSQYYGQRYCPKAVGQIPQDQWIAQKRAERKEKRNTE